MGFNKVFTILDKSNCPKAILQELPSVKESDLETCRLSLNAHKVLMNLSDDNKTRFKDVVQALGE